MDEKVAKLIDEMTKPLFVDCIECGAAIGLTNRAKLYCSDACHQTLKVIHYGRSAKADGRYDLDPTIEDAIRMRIAHILAGGYHEYARRIPPALRTLIFERDGGKCVMCGALATQIDHIAGDSSRPDNLRAACGACNFGLAEQRMVRATPKQSAIIDQLLERIFAPKPLYERDDEKAWPATCERLMAERRTQVRTRLVIRNLLEKAKE